MNVETANKLVGLRKKHGLSQEELAEKIGVSRQAVSKWERAEASPDTENLIALAKIYNISLDEMLDLEKNVGVSYAPNEKQQNEEHADKSKYKLLKRIPIPIVAVIAYFLIGYVWGLWHPGWLVFMIIPIWYAIVR